MISIDRVRRDTMIEKMKLFSRRYVVVSWYRYMYDRITHGNYRGH